MNLRAAGKLFWFAAIVVSVSVAYIFTAAFASAKNKRRARAAWMHRSARKFIRLFGCRPEVPDAIPARGLLVSNHLSYLDIVLLGSVTPAVFVSKADVKGWPVFGMLTCMAGTVYIQRERRQHVGEVNREIESALADDLLVVIFPEGTSSDGQGVLPFRSSLLEPALRGGHDISVSHIAYALPGGDASQEVCYWGDHTFFPHLLNLLGKKTVNAKLRFGKFQRSTDDRKELAGHLHAAVLELKSRKLEQAGTEKTEANRIGR
jgi:1-acyl-sn-glycerol-3-phosphate acyltransferase